MGTFFSFPGGDFFGSGFLSHFVGRSLLRHVEKQSNSLKGTNKSPAFIYSRVLATGKVIDTFFFGNQKK